ncbi:stalk domain-containing protein [Paenibacillus sp.]|uniref:stalk domain-containing protein n=1 Tax=Paenibacillus sp. TaxID=58172 RepID=UPI002D31FFA2|nr:stalk domain-containing protein [Paenibacillus sp.]HZG86479.1 stalk domain-containing protein [Paenibacillus sp.]
MRFGKPFAALLAAVLLVGGLPSGTAQAVNIWALYNQALAAEAKGDCAAAVDKLTGMIPTLVDEKNYTNAANIYKKIGDCRAKLKQYDLAVQAWDQESANWKLAGLSAETAASKRRADYLRSTVKLFAAVQPQALADTYDHGARFEPTVGAYLGAYAESNAKVHDTKHWKYFYTEKFPELTGRKHAAYLLYTTWGRTFQELSQHVKEAKEHGTALQIALQPMNGLSEVVDGPYLREYARAAGESGVPIFLRFANEMNGNWVPWYGNPQQYIEKFRLVANVFREEAPDNVVMVWAPNDIPVDTITQYYPGDEYVDWIGVSLYSIYNPSLDPLKAGVDRSNHLQKFEYIYNLYAKKKPLFISEGAISYVYPEENRLVDEWAAYRTKEFYATLPMLYPGVKGVFWFDATKTEAAREKHFMLTANEAMLEAYRDAVQHPFYLDTVGEESQKAYINVAEAGVPPRPTELSAYVQTLEPMLGKVEYAIQGRTIGSATAPPWTIRHDFAPYRGKPVTITVKAYARDGTLVTTQQVKAAVGDALVTLKGERIDFDSQPKIVNGRMFVPVKQIADALLANTVWNAATQSISLKDEAKGLSVEFAIGSTAARKNGMPVTLEAAPFAHNGRTYIPLSFVAEAFGLAKSWDDKTGTAVFQ